MNTGLIRAAILDVLDMGHLCGKDYCTLFHPWQFEFRVPETDEENKRRVDFADAVLTRISELEEMKTPPPAKFP